MSQKRSAGVERIRFPAAATDPRFREFFDYWRSKAPPGRLPGRQHIDPLEMPAFLPYIVLTDVLRSGDGTYRFRYRLLGTHASEILPSVVPGNYVDEVSFPDHYRTKVYPETVALIETHQPNYTERKTPVMVDNFIRYCRLKLPLAADGRTVDMIFGLYIGVRADGALAEA